MFKIFKKTWLYSNQQDKEINETRKTIQNMKIEIEFIEKPQ